MGVLSFAGYRVQSNNEAGKGRPDVVLRDEKTGRAMVIEIKRAVSPGEMEAGCGKALAQIRNRRYEEGLEAEHEDILCYGICFYKKRCRVKGKKWK